MQKLLFSALLKVCVIETRHDFEMKAPMRTKVKIIRHVTSLTILKNFPVVSGFLSSTSSGLDVI
jgi:hypothetical protein